MLVRFYFGFPLNKALSLATPNIFFLLLTEGSLTFKMFRSIFCPIRVLNIELFRETAKFHLPLVLWTSTIFNFVVQAPSVLIQNVLLKTKKTRKKLKEN